MLGDVDHETQLHGLAVSSEIISHTGVGGLTLGGGFFWISRKHGLSVDNLISAEVVIVPFVYLGDKERGEELIKPIRQRQIKWDPQNIFRVDQNIRP